MSRSDVSAHALGTATTIPSSSTARSGMSRTVRMYGADPSLCHPVDTPRKILLLRGTDRLRDADLAGRRS